MPTLPYDSLPPRKRIFCYRCGRETNHDCMADHYYDYSNLDDEGNVMFLERDGYRLWICAGCETGIMENYYVPDGSPDGDFPSEDFGGYIYLYFPERRVSPHPLKQFKQIPEKLEAIYQEVVLAFDRGMNRLCTIGMRSLIEGICADKEIKGRTIEEKIKKMVDIPLPQNIVDNLHALRIMGNQAAHELGAPDKDELTLAIEICEDLLNAIYELDYRTSLLAEIREKKGHSSIRSELGMPGKIIPFKKPSEGQDQQPVDQDDS